MLCLCSKRVRTQSELNVSGQRQGEVNSGYLPDGQSKDINTAAYDALYGQYQPVNQQSLNSRLLTGIAPSDLTDSGFSQVNGSNINEVWL